MIRPFLMLEAEAVSLKDAARRTKLSVDTIRRLVAEHGIGRQMGPGSRIEVSLPALIMVRHGDLEALELLRAGQRDEPTVQQYMNLLTGI